jgi:tellurite resistance-related uncharacterized protein
VTGSVLPDSPPQLPNNVVLLRSTPIFTANTLPALLRENHCTKEGSWGRIRIISGQLRYEVCDPRRPSSTRIVSSHSVPVIIEPTILHRVEPVGEVEFQVEFWRAPEGP